MAFILGTPFDDFLVDQFSSDFVAALGGNDLIVLLDDGLNDTVLAQEGDDTIYVLDRTGDNLIDGGSEISHDTVNYSFLGESITLKAQGILEKASGGVDSLVGIESIVAGVGPGIVNTIDGSDAGPASLNVNLGANSLIVNGLGFPLSFKVFNFDNVRGTHNNDSITGNTNDNVFFGSKGHDVYDGGSLGYDTVDYSGLGQRITLKARGIVDKGSAGIDQLLGNPLPFTPSIDRVIGATGQRNLIDGRVAGPTPTTFKVNLAQEKLAISGFGTFDVVEFKDIIGTANNDVLKGDATQGLSNIIFGQQGNDTIVGVDENSFRPGQKEIDVFFGGSGSDNFVVGEFNGFFGFSNQDYYLSNSTFLDPFGNDDYALIVDFELFNDRLTLGRANPYLFNVFGPVVDIYANIGTNFAAIDSRDDLIARVVLGNPIDLAVPPSTPKKPQPTSPFSPKADELTGIDGVNPFISLKELGIEDSLKVSETKQVLDAAFSPSTEPTIGGIGSIGEVFTLGSLPQELSGLVNSPIVAIDDPIILNPIDRDPFPLTPEDRFAIA